MHSILTWSDLQKIGTTKKFELHGMFELYRIRIRGSLPVFKDFPKDLGLWQKSSNISTKTCPKGAR